MSDWEDFCDIAGLDHTDPDAIDKFYERESRAEELEAAARNPFGEAFKAFLLKHADRECGRCRGTGYLGKWKEVEAGRCFLCFPDARWKELGFN